MIRFKLLISLCLLGLFVSCAGNDSAKSVLMVSIPPQKCLLEEIVGDDYEVRSLLSSSSNPETYEPSINDLKALSRAEGYFAMGNMPFESSLLERIAASNPGLPIYDCSAGVALLYGTHGDCGHHHEGESCGSHGLPDPHTWSSVKNARVMVKNMRDAVVKINPARSKLYDENFSRLNHRLDSMDRAIAERLGPLKGNAFLVWHPSLSYFARDYGLRQIAVGQEGKEASVVGTQRQIDEARNHGAKVFFSQREYDSSQASTVNAQVGAKIIAINPMNENWEEEINVIVNALYGN